MGILLCEQNVRDIRNKSVRAEIGQILRTHTQTHTHTTAAKLVVRITMYYGYAHSSKLNKLSKRICVVNSYKLEMLKRNAGRIKLILHNSELQLFLIYSIISNKTKAFKQFRDYKGKN